MNHMHDNEVNNIYELNLLHDIINPPKHTKILIATTILFCVDVLILERVKQSLRTFESYWIVDVVPRL